MGSLHLYLPFSMEYRARAPSIRSRLLPTLRTFHLLVPPISMLQQHLPQHLSHQLPPLLRQLARNLIKTRFGMLFPPIPHRLKHLLRTTHKLRLRLFSFHLIPLFLFSTFLLPPVYLPSASQKNLGCTLPARDASQIWGGNRLAGSQCQRWLELFTVFGRDTVQAPGLAVRWNPSVGEGARAGTRSAPTGPVRGGTELVIPTGGLIVYNRI